MTRRTPVKGPGRHRRRHRYGPAGRIVLVTTAVAVTGLAGTEFVRPTATLGSWSGPAIGTPPPAPAAPTTEPSATPRSAMTLPISFPERGDRTWAAAPGRSPVAGTGGRLLRYRAVVENGIEHVTAAQFAEQVDRILADPRSWTGTGRLRLQRVGKHDAADFTVYLSTPATRDHLCARGYDRYTSCRNGDRVVINVARWASGAAAFRADLDTYRAYVVNHEVGHRLGHGHQRCPGAGRPAPVMQQQTLGLHGCRPHPWPLRGGKAYTGPSGAYQDPLPEASDR